MSCSERFWISFFTQTFPKHILYGIYCTTLLWSQLIHLGSSANGACYNTSYHSQSSLQNPVPHSVWLAKDKVISCHLGFSLLQVVARTGSPNWHFNSINCQNIFSHMLCIPIHCCKFVDALSDFSLTTYKPWNYFWDLKTFRGMSLYKPWISSLWTNNY